MTFVWTPFAPLLLAIDAAIVGTAALCLWRFTGRFAGEDPRRRPLRPVLAAYLMGFFPWAAGSLLIGGILGFFLLARVLWTLSTVWLPGAMAWRASRCRSRAMICIALALVGCKYYGEVWEPSRLEVARVRVPVPGLKSVVRVVHLSDLQTDGIGAMQLRAREASNGFSPHVIAFTGDIMNHPSLEREVGEYLGGFRASSGAYFVTGNVDRPAEVGPMLERAGFRWLDARSRTVEIEGSRIALLGLGLGDYGDKALLQRLAAEAGPADARVVLSHLPDALETARAAPVDLLLAGHTHGGQVCPPFLGPIVTLSRVPRSIAAGGLHRVDRLWVHVSRGLGWEGHIAPRVRTFCRPHLALIELVPGGSG